LDEFSITITMTRRSQRLLRFALAVMLPLFQLACASSTTTYSRGQPEAPRGFFDRLADAISERECNVIRFTCPYGFGAADEPCDCTDPKGVVLQGRTVK
jgi:hypothetical protein